MKSPVQNSKYFTWILSLLGGEAKFPLLGCGLSRGTASQRDQLRKEEERVSFMVEEPDKPYLSQVTKANTNSHKSCGHQTPLMWSPYLHGCLPQTQSSSLIVRKASEKPPLRDPI